MDEAPTHMGELAKKPAIKRVTMIVSTFCATAQGIVKMK